MKTDSFPHRGTLFLLCCVLVLAACTATLPTRSSSVGAQLTLRADWNNLKRAPQIAPGFRTLALDLLQIAQADAFVSGPGLNGTLTPDSPQNPFALPNGNGSPVIRFDNLPLGPNRVVTVQARDRNGELLPGYVIKGVVDLSAGENQVQVTPQTTPTAQVIEELVARNSELARTVDHRALQELVDALISNQTPDAQDDLVPGLIHAEALAEALIAANGVLPTADRTRFALKSGSLRVNLRGLGEPYKLNDQSKTLFPPVTLSLNDATSEVLTLPARNDEGSPASVSYTLSNIRPGQSYTLKVAPDYHRERTQTVSISEGQTLSVSLNFSASDKRHYFQDAIRGSANTIRRYRNDEVLDILLIKPSQPELTARGWDPNLHLQAAQTAVDQLRRYFPMISIGQVDEVFDNDPGFNTVPMPSLGQSFNALPSDPRSPNAPQNQGPAPAGHLVGRYDLYLRWRTDFCSEGPTTLGVCRHAFASVTPDTYINSLELAVQSCEGNVVNFDNAVSVAVHEMLHALGTSGHSTRESDLMTVQLNLTRPLQLRPNVRDIFTLRMLYDAEASKTNRAHRP